MTQTLLTKIPDRFGLNIAVLAEIPENPAGVMFIMHGWKSNKVTATATAFAEIAVAQNMVAVRFDCTHSNGESDGDITKSTVTTFLDNLDDVIAWAKTQTWFQAPYILAGTSLGGTAMLAYAHDHQDEIKAIAPVASVISGQLSIESRNRRDPDAIEKWRTTGFEHQKYTNGQATFPWSHMADRLLYDALLYAPTLTMPVFLCGGSEDETCPPDHQRLLYDALGSADKELHVIDGAPHILREPEHLSVLKAHFSDWLGRVNRESGPVPGAGIA